MSLTTHDLGINPQILTDTVKGAFAQKNALMGSGLASQGAVVINDSFDVRDPRRIGTKVTVPYFGLIGDFVDNADGNASTPQSLGEVDEEATVARSSLSVDITRWAHYGVAGDPYAEATRQIQEAAQRRMDQVLLDNILSSGNALTHQKYSATTPYYMNWDMIVDAKSKWRDEQQDMVAMVVNSRTQADMLKLRDADGRPLLIDSMASAGPGQVMRFCGFPVVVSDKLPTTGSSMGTVTSAGTTPPTAPTLTGTPTGAWDLKIKITTGGTLGTAKFQFSTDGGDHYSADILCANAAFELTDTAVDSLVGFNGKTGLTISFAAGTYAADNVYTATAKLKARSLLLRRNALAFWYNRMALELLVHPDVLNDATIAVMHLYAAPHTYRRVPQGTVPGVILIDHNVQGYNG